MGGKKVMFNSVKRKECAVTFMSEMVINLAKAADKEKNNKEYYNELIDAMTMATHILKNTKDEMWKFIGDPGRKT